MNSALTHSSSRRALTLLLASVVAIILSAAIAQSASASFACIELNPPTADNQLPQQSTHTVTATVRTTYDYTKTPSGPTNPVNLAAEYGIWWAWVEYYGTLPEYAGLDPRSTVNGQQLYNVAYPDICSRFGEQLPLLHDAPVSFSIVSGPNSGGAPVTVNTDANGQATFTWSSTTAGTDTVQASVPRRHVVDQYAKATPAVPATTTVLTGAPANATAVKNWIPPQTPPVNPPVTSAGTPSATLVVPSVCQKRNFYIRASTKGGTIKKIVLKIDGKTAKVIRTVKTSAGRKFLINTGKYGPGTHKINLTTYFTNGSRVVKTGRFKLCKIRTSQRRISPNFTG